MLSPEMAGEAGACSITSKARAAKPIVIGGERTAHSASTARRIQPAREEQPHRNRRAVAYGRWFKSLPLLSHADPGRKRPLPVRARCQWSWVSSGPCLPDPMPPGGSAHLPARLRSAGSCPGPGNALQTPRIEDARHPPWSERAAFQANEQLATWPPADV